jgi:hypothetical protein
MAEEARLEDRAAIADQMFRYARATDWLETERHRDWLETERHRDVGPKPSPSFAMLDSRSSTSTPMWKIDEESVSDMSVPHMPACINACAY